MVEKVDVESIPVGVSDDEKLHIFYTPQNTQVLRAGITYEFVIKNNAIEHEDKPRGKQAKL